MHGVLAAYACRQASASTQTHTGTTYLRGAVEHGAIRDVRVSRDPATVGGAEKNVTWPVVEGVLERGRCPHHVPRSSMHDSLWLPGRPAGVQHE